MDLCESSSSPLPLILFPVSGLVGSHPPTSVEGEWREKNNDVIRGTIKFKGDYSSDLLTMFCAVNVDIWNNNKPNVKPDDENCNYPIKFDDYSDPIKCAYEPRPFIKTLIKKTGTSHSVIPCGPRQIGKMYGYAYKLCITQYPIEASKIEYARFPNSIPHSMKYFDEFEVFRFCYDDQRKQILHTEHKIMSPKLLFDGRLQRERDIIYETMLDDRNIFMLDLEKTIKKFLKTENAQSSDHSTKFKLQKLAPTEDFAFALWRKTTYHLLNLKVMRADLIELWDHICLRIRELVSKPVMFEKYYIHTGAYQIIQGELDITQHLFETPDVWLKKIYRCNYDSLAEVNICRSLFIYMDQNFDNDSAIDPSKITCEKNLCEDAFLEKFTAAGKSIRCCFVSDDYEAKKNNFIIREEMTPDFLYDGNENDDSND